MINARFYLEKNSILNCTFACLDCGNVVHKFRISDGVKRFISLKKDAGYDYLLTLQYSNGEIDEEYWEFDYLFNKAGIRKTELQNIKDVYLV